MTKYEINKPYNHTVHKQTVEASEYRQEGDYFVFYDRSSEKVLTVKADRVLSIDVVTD